MITWDAATDNGAAPTGLDHYDVYRGATKIGSTAGLSFQDDAVSLDGSYVYTVRAVDRAQNASARDVAGDRAVRQDAAAAGHEPDGR